MKRDAQGRFVSTRFPWLPDRAYLDSVRWHETTEFAQIAERIKTFLEQPSPASV
jgi:hypothetical protein